MLADSASSVLSSVETPMPFRENTAWLTGIATVDHAMVLPHCPLCVIDEVV